MRPLYSLLCQQAICCLLSTGRLGRTASMRLSLFTFHRRLMSPAHSFNCPHAGASAPGLLTFRKTHMQARGYTWNIYEHKHTEDRSEPGLGQVGAFQADRRSVRSQIHSQTGTSAASGSPGRWSYMSMGVIRKD